MRWCLALVVLLVASAATAQDSCETRCNQQASECLKACTGDAKETSKPENAQKSLACVKRCDAAAAPCRKQCPRPSGNSGPSTRPPRR
jgi:hypothetical protein